ncbi:hypothetical protein PQQ86_39120 [Paraburkholderia sediminicola]|uniref:GAP1-N1 domain-containing protein n=1 Tax=Paraburkholderia sediminicola TaxID=458836 RepID=UPI0038BD4738
MNEELISQQLHGYRRGHELLASSMELVREDQDAVDQLSDISGPLGPGETFEPYLTAYPLPSGSHYVLARTWQDLSAPRAGCVLTRSVFIPISVWSTAQSLASFLALLVPFDRGVSKVDVSFLPTSSKRLPTASDPRLGDLVEALFLETRRPIVMFDAADAEVVAERLLVSFFPSLKRKFSLSTFCTAPRLLDGKDFDLSFAPITARQRFSNFSGRRIDVVPRPVRHRWTQPLVERLFRAPRPSLFDPSTVSLIQLDRIEEEAELRVALLWSELWAQKAESPSATLGLLDVLTSRNLLSETIGQLSPVVVRSIEMTPSTHQVFDALQFIDTLLGKFAQVRLPHRIAACARRTVAELAVSAPKEALRYLLQRRENHATASALTLAGLGDGLEAVGILSDQSEGAQVAVPQLVLQVGACSRRFASKLVALCDHDEWREQINIVFRAFEFCESHVQKRLRQRIVPLLVRPHHSTILRCVMRGADHDAVLWSVATVGATTGLGIPEFDAPLLDAVGDEVTRRDLHNFTARLTETPSSTRFLSQSLSLTSSDIEWVANNDTLSAGRAALLLAAMVDAADDSDLRRTLQEESTAATALGVVRSFAEQHAPQVGRILLAAKLEIEDAISVGSRILSIVGSPLQYDLARSLVQRALAESSAELNPTIVQVVNAGIVEMPTVVEFARQPFKGRRSVGENLAVLAALSGDSRDQVLAQIDNLSGHLARLPVASLNNSATRIWASMIDDAKLVNYKAHLSATWTALEYAFRFPGAPASPLVVTSFPVVYEELRRGNDPPWFASTFFFGDWDRCKTLRRDLVRAFMTSQWPPGDLLLAAHYAGESGEILRRLVKQWGGRDYFVALKGDVERFEEPLRTELREEIANFGRW